MMQAYRKVSSARKLTTHNIAILQFISSRNDNRKAILFLKIFLCVPGFEATEPPDGAIKARSDAEKAVKSTEFGQTL
jgi:uncharacterized protein (DUF1499 family)